MTKLWCLLLPLACAALGCPPVAAPEQGPPVTEEAERLADRAYAESPNNACVAAIRRDVRHLAELRRVALEAAVAARAAADGAEPAAPAPAAAAVAPQPVGTVAGPDTVRLADLEARVTVANRDAARRADTRAALLRESMMARARELPACPGVGLGVVLGR